jgi:hypothetical protein
MYDILVSAVTIHTDRPRFHLRTKLFTENGLSNHNFLDKVTLLNNRRWLGNVLAEDFALDEVRQPHLQLVVDELLRRDRKYLCGIVKTGGALVERKDLRSISSSVSCLVSLTKQKIMPQAMRFNPA